MPTDTTVLLRRVEHAKAVLPEILRQSDPQVTFGLHRFDELAGGWLTQERLTAGLAGAFGTLALLLAAVGLYGVMSYWVSRRRAELAVRLALGATGSSIARLVVGQDGLMVLAGVLVGAGLSWWGAWYVQNLLFEHDARDLPTIVGAAVILALTGLIAAWLPARRAARFTPAELLRDS